MKSFSVIIPMYNAENYIEKTLNSIVKANYDQNKIEVIVVDDASKDNSCNIVEKISKEHKNIQLVKKINGQWGSVINYAKNNNLVKNEYVSILDADDFYDKETFNIINNLNNDDILCGSFKKFDGNKNRKKVLPYWFIFKRKIKSKTQMLSPFCLPLPYFFKKEIFYKIDDLTEGVAYQDPDFFSQIVRHANSLSFTKKVVGYYYYNRANNSVSQKWDDKRFNPELNACLKCLEHNAQETVSYRLNIKDFYRLVQEKNIKFKINRKFKFNWYPFYIRWVYAILHNIKYKKLFEKIK